LRRTQHTLDALIQRAQTLRRDGWNNATIAVELGVTSRTVQRWLEHEPIPIRHADQPMYHVTGREAPVPDGPARRMLNAFEHAINPALPREQRETAAMTLGDLAGQYRTVEPREDQHAWQRFERWLIAGAIDRRIHGDEDIAA
jgi:hypothetical protein